jgi:hypothetical protein
VNSHNAKDESGSTLTVSATERGQVKISAGTIGAPEGLPLLYVGRIVWDSAGA